MSPNPTPIAANTDERINQLEQQIADQQLQTRAHIAETRSALQAQSDQITEVLRRLSQLIPATTPAAPTERTGGLAPEGIAAFVSRRSMLKKAALATLGAAAVLETMPSAKAANGSDLVLGNTSNSATGTTGLTSSVSGPALNVTNSGYSTSCNGITGSSLEGTGVSGSSYSNLGVSGMSGLGTGVMGIGGNNSTLQHRMTPQNLNCIGVSGSSYYGFGVSGISTFPGDKGSVGVYGSSSYSSGSGVYAVCTGTNGIGVQGVGGQYGADLTGVTAPLFLSGNANISDPNNPPMADLVSHLSGELFVDSAGGLWYCTDAGTPGAWSRLAMTSPAGGVTAGKFFLLEAPTRFIDTRQSSTSYTGIGAPPTGSVGTFYYHFSGTNALTPYTPMGTTAPVIPFGATGLVGRITVLSGESGSSVGGELKVSNVSPPGFGSGLIIWGTTTATQILPFVLPLNNTSVSGSGVMYFENTSASDTIDLIVDVTGYYY